MTEPSSAAALPFTGDVVVSSPHWSLNGANVFSERLVRALCRRGVRAHVLLTGSETDDVKPLPLPPDLPLRRLARRDASRRNRLEAMIRHLVDRSEEGPCIWIPNHDYAYSCVAPALPDRVGIVGVLHSDDPQHYAHARHLARFWNATVAVSRAIAQEAVHSDPHLGMRLQVIEHGVDLAEKPRREHRDAGAPLRMIYVGRLAQRQKRVLDLVGIVAALVRHGVPAELSVVGGGADEAALREAARPWVATGQIRFLGIVPTAAVRDLLVEHDVLIQTSDFEGLSLTLLEGMAAGCVPVVTDLRSGVREVVRDGENGYAIEIGDIDGFVDRLALLQRDADLCSRLSKRARDTLVESGYTLDAMTDRYLDLFGRVAKEIEDGGYRRPAAAVEPLPWMLPSWKDRLPKRVRRGLSRMKGVLR